MADRFSETAQRIVLRAQDEAAWRRQDTVTPEHVLIALLSMEKGEALEILSKAGVDARSLLKELEMRVGVARPCVPLKDVSFAPSVKRLLERAVTEANRKAHAYVGSGHLLLGLLSEEGSLAEQALRDAGVTFNVLDRFISEESL